MRTPRFNDYREITAKYASVATACGTKGKAGGHAIAMGDTIGYSPNRGASMCASCWQAWCCENAEAQACEDQCESMGMELGREGGELC